MRPRTDASATLASALEIIVGDSGSLAFRLKSVAPSVVRLDERDFAIGELRSRFRALKADLVLMGLVDDGGRLNDIDRPTAMILAVRFLGLCFAIAHHEAELG